ncbi:MAG TPA: hypothetical protein VFN10_15995 [Thermoanaerobaculia bacterium]|nr:hypothetical protein [Thermoanaerobaculia bacterium]
MSAGAQYGSRTPRELSTAPEIRSIVATANRNGITVYAFHPDTTTYNFATPGPSTGADAQHAAMLANLDRSSLQYAAVSTGGAAASAHDATRLLEHLGDDIDSYYSLGYQPAAGGGARHSISVKTKNRAYHARARFERVEKTPEDQIGERVIASLYEAPHAEGLPVRVFLDRPHARGKLTSYPFRIRVPINALTLLPSRHQYTGGFTVLLAWGGSHGTISDVRASRQPIAVGDKNLRVAQTQYVTYELELAAAPTIERVSIAVMDERSREVGLVRFDIPKIR